MRKGKADELQKWKNNSEETGAIVQVYLLDQNIQSHLTLNKKERKTSKKEKEIKNN